MLLPKGKAEPGMTPSSKALPKPSKGKYNKPESVKPIKRSKEHDLHHADQLKLNTRLTVDKGQQSMSIPKIIQNVNRSCNEKLESRSFNNHQHGQTSRGGKNIKMHLPKGKTEPRMTPSSKALPKPSKGKDKNESGKSIRGSKEYDHHQTDQSKLKTHLTIDNSQSKMYGKRSRDEKMESGISAKKPIFNDSIKKTESLKSNTYAVTHKAQARINVANNSLSKPGSSSVVNPSSLFLVTDVPSLSEYRIPKKRKPNNPSAMTTPHAVKLGSASVIDKAQPRMDNAPPKPRSSSVANQSSQCKVEASPIPKKPQSNEEMRKSAEAESTLNNPALSKTENADIQEKSNKSETKVMKRKINWEEYRSKHNINLKEKAQEKIPLKYSYHAMTMTLGPEDEVHVEREYFVDKTTKNLSKPTVKEAVTQTLDSFIRERKGGLLAHNEDEIEKEEESMVVEMEGSEIPVIPENNSEDKIEIETENKIEIQTENKIEIKPEDKIVIDRVKKASPAQR